MKSDGANSLTLNQRPSLGDEVYDKLLAEIISLRFPPGDRLSVDGLSRMIGVSQTPVRAALIRLEAEGLVEKKHNSGYYVSPHHSGEKFREIYEVRLLLEPAVAAGAAINATQSEIDHLARLANDMMQLVAEDPEANYSRFALIDRQFHEELAQCCGNSLIASALGRLHTHMHLFRLRYHSSVARNAAVEHQEIVEAIQARDADAAERSMRRHIEISHERMRPYYQNI